MGLLDHLAGHLLEVGRRVVLGRVREQGDAAEAPVAAGARPAQVERGHLGVGAVGPVGQGLCGLGPGPGPGAGAGAGGFRSHSLSRGAASSLSLGLGLGLAYRRAPGLAAAADGLDLSQAAARTNEYKIIRTNEKEQLQGLNDRFAVFIEKVHQLETQNRALEAELAALRQRHAEPSRVGELFERELRELRAQLEEASSARAQALLERDALADEAQRLRARCEEESRGREAAERALKAQQRDADGATLARLDLEKKVEALLDELAFVRQVHEEEVAELLATLQASSQAAAAAELDVAAAAKPDLSSALREIRAQYESLAAKNLQSAEEWYKSKFANLNEQAARSTEAIRASREEIHEYRRQLQARTIEIEGLRGANESLERQILELEERHGAEVAGYQVGADWPPCALPPTHARAPTMRGGRARGGDGEPGSGGRTPTGGGCEQKKLWGVTLGILFSYPSLRFLPQPFLS